MTVALLIVGAIALLILVATVVAIFRDKDKGGTTHI